MSEAPLDPIKEMTAWLRQSKLQVLPHPPRNMFSRLRLSLRITALGVGIMVVFSLVTASLYPKLKSQFYNEKKDKTRNLVEVASSVIDSYFQLEQGGALTREEAQTAAKRLLADLNYDSSNYFWINDLHPTMVMHPVKPALDGKDLSDIADPNGKRLFVEMAEVARSTGAGYVDYYWPKPGQEKPAAKISYIKLQKDWGWIIGSGIYVDDVQAQLSALFTYLFGILGIVTIGSGFAFFYLARSISRPIDRIIEKVEQGSNRISAASTQVSNCANRLAEEVSFQANSLVEASTAVDKTSSMTNRNAEHSSQANELMNSTNQIIEEASSSMQTLTESMISMTKSSEETSKIVKTIDEIAFQTNILALNAAVEAARAGESGAGFAVVADEVRSLAQRAAKAAQETNRLIDDTVQKIHQGSKIVDQTAESFRGAADQSTQLRLLIEEINSATHQQASGIGDISSTIAKIDDITQQNASNAEESASAARKLNSEADELNWLIDDLAAIVNGKDPSQLAHQPKPISQVPKQSKPANRLSKTPALVNDEVWF